MTGTRARAEEPSCAEGDRSCGAKAFAQATAAFDTGQYPQAIAWFLAAEHAERHPIISFNLGLCYARSSMPSAAYARFAKLAEDVSLDRDLRERSRRELAALEGKVAHVMVEMPDAGMSLEWDDRRIDAASRDLVVDPGSHRVRVTSADAVLLDQEIKLEPGERFKLHVTNRARAMDVIIVGGASGTGSSAGPGARVAGAPAVTDPSARSPDPATMAGPSSSAASGGATIALTQPASRTGISPEWFYGAAMATAALGSVALWSALDVQSAYRTYEADLPNLTQAEADARVSDGHGREIRTNVLLGVTLVSAAATTLIALLWVDWRTSPQRPIAGSIRPAAGGFSGAF